MPVPNAAEGGWIPMPAQQQRGAQMPESAGTGGAPPEATQDRAAQQNDEADQQVAGVPAQGIDYPAGKLEARSDDITPSAREPDSQSWDDVVQPEGHARQAGPAQAPVKQHNNAQEATGRDLPDPERAADFDQDEG